MVLLPSAPLTLALSYVPASSSQGGGPPAPCSVTTLPLQDLTPEERKRKDRRVHKWWRMLVPQQPGGDVSNWVVHSRKEHKFVSRVYKGMPDRWRSAAWWILIEWQTDASLQAAAKTAGTRAVKKDSGSLGRQYRVSTIFVGYERRDVLIGGLG